MKKKFRGFKRILAAAMAVTLVLTGLPDANISASAAATIEGVGVIATVDDPQTLTRPTDTYGDSTLNAGKILVGKSVTDGVNDTTGAAEPLDLTGELGNMPAGSATTFLPAENNFLVTVSQTAQMYGVSSQMPVPLDVVFILDTSGSMSKVDTGSSQNRAHDAVDAINAAIKELMELNEYNRVSVVAFSGHNSDWANDGATTADNDAANVLSELAHYSDAAASNHLTWNGAYLLGRSTVNGKTASRNGYSGGTNIQAGIALGAQQLLNVTDITVTIDGKEYTRMPFIVLVSDGAPIMSSPDNDWWNPDMIDHQNGLNDNYGEYTYAGNGFLSVLTASYYKNMISKKYYPNGEQSATFYTIGLGLDAENSDQEGSESKLSRMTLNPSEEFYNTENVFYQDFQSYWNSYRTGQAFSVPVGAAESGADDDGIRGSHNGYYYFYPTSTTAGVRNDHQTFVNVQNGNDKQLWVMVDNGTRMEDNILEEVTSILYNDAYYDVETSGQMAEVFKELVIEIQKRAITDPTKVDEVYGKNFSGYVNFTDIIGEYMEVKDIKGVTNNGYLYQGKTFAQLALNYKANWESSTSTSAAQAEFNAALEEAVVTRMNAAASGSTQITKAQVRTLMEAVVSPVSTANPYGGQIYYNSESDYSNSFVWFGKIHYPEDENNITEEDYQVEFVQLAPKDADSVSWITDEANAQTIAAAADAADCGTDEKLCIVRSYYLYGTAGGVNTGATGEYLNFSLRTIRTLDDPYKHYVSISAPASLLSVQHVLIDDTDPENPIAHYDDLIPTRVIYEVGLQEGITADNVWSTVNEDYLNEYGNVNADGSINFYTNDYKRYDNAEDAAGHTGAVHDHALTYVTFDVSDSNSFYRYEEDTLLVDAKGNPITGNLTAGADYYYKRTYYTWTPGGMVDGKVQEGIAPASKTSAYIKVTMPSDLSTASVYQDSTTGYWYIKEGTYTAFTLTAGDDILKEKNETGTAHIVSHPERTGSATNSHYTTWLGNNGKLTFKGVPAKTVMRDDPSTQVVENANIDGELVKVGETLTYQIRVTNSYDEDVTVKITDEIPAGTEFVADSIKNGVLASNGSITWDRTAAGTYNSGTITWEIKDVTPGTTVVVSFDVLVVEGAVKVGQLTNAADVEMPEVSNKYTTNMTKNPVTGKAALDMNGGALPEDGVAVGDVIRYDIAYFNDTDETAAVKVTDSIPVGAEYVENSASHTPKSIHTDANNVVTGLEWEFTNIAPGTGGVVSFRVRVIASVQDSTLDEDTAPDVVNKATITIDNDPDVVIETNPTITPVKTGDLKLAKTVTGAVTATDGYTFKLKLTESTGKLTGTYALTGATAQSVTFTNGVAEVEIKAGQEVAVNDLPAGVTITVTEPDPGTGFTAEISNNGTVTIPADAAAPVSVTVTNTYKAGAAKLTIGGTKNFTNNGLYENTQKFYFELKESTGGISSQAAALVADVSLTAAAGETTSDTFEFAELTFDTVGTHTYQLLEIKSGFGGVKYDTTVYDLKVDVTDDGSGTLQIKVSVKDVAADTWTEVAVDAAANKIDLTKLVFSNSYKPLRETLTLVGKKTLTNGTLTDDQFSFVVKEGTETVATGQSKKDGSIAFTTIVYTEAGEHIYTVEELTGAAGMLYGGQKYYVKVVLTGTESLTKTVYVDANLDADAEDWVLVTSTSANDPTVSTTTPLKFSNTYDRTSVTLVGTKTLNGRNMQTDEFDFIVVDKATGDQVSVGSNATAADGEEAAISFQAIEYTKADLGDNNSKTFTYVISEVKEGKDGIAYDETKYEVTVKVTYDAVSGWTVEETYPAGGIRFTNTYTPDPVSIALVIGNKITNGANAPEDLKFGYKVTKAEGANDNIPVGQVVATGTSGKDGQITLSDLTFTAAGTYKAILEEDCAGQTIHGVTYDSAKYLLVITVDQNKDTGELSITGIKYYKTDDPNDYSNPVDSAGVVFENTYAAKGSLTLQATKEVTGREMTSGAYEFELTTVSGNDSVSGGDAHTYVATNDGAGKVVFESLNYTEDDLGKTFIYKVKEKIGNLLGIEYDKSEYEITVTPQADSEDNSKIVITPSIVKTKDKDGNSVSEAVSNLEFKNEGTIYKGISLPVTITKTLTGRSMQDNEFGFVMTYIGKTDKTGTWIEAAPGTIEDTTFAGTKDANSVEVGLDVSISAAEGIGQYVFDISEVDGRKEGVTYDKSVWRVYIDVTDADQNGELEAVVANYAQIKDAQGNDITSPTMVTTAPVFKNTYKATSAEVNLVGQKILNGRDLNADEFDFEILETGYTTIDGQTTTHAAPILRATASNTADTAENNAATGTINFTTITLEDTGTYMYKVVELTNGNLPGMTYSEDVYTLKIEVTDPGTGELETKIYVGEGENATAFVDYTANTQLQFTNTYDAADTTIKLPGTKTLTGRDMTAGEFTFNVYLTSYAEGENATPITYQDQEAAIGRNEAAVDGAEASIDFAEIPYSKAGIYTYRISEADTDAKNVTKDSGVYEVVVTVEDNSQTGKLEAKITSILKGVKQANDSYAYSEAEAIAFTNTYEPTPTTAVVQAAKILTGKPWNGEEFTFKLKETTALSGDDVNGSITEKNDESGIVVFDLTFTEKGVYKYQMSEVGTDTENMNYDESTWNVIVNVTDDGNGTLTAEVTYDDGTPVFYNEYIPSEYPAKLEDTLDITKELTGRDMKNGEFSFIVKDIQGNDVAKGTNKADGSVVFDYDLTTEAADGDGITFKRAGIYRYSISEAAGTANGMTYDPAVWYVQFEIEQDAESGELYLKGDQATIIEGRDSEADPAAGKVVFTNTYDAVDAKVTLTGQKFMTGARTNVREGEFVFHLLDADNNIVSRGTTDAAGKIVFEELTFDKVSEHRYTLVEVHSSEKGIEYNINNDAYTVKIDVAEKVSEDGTYMGELVAHVFIDGEAYDPSLTGSNAQITFTNRYTPEAAVVTINAEKRLNGRDLVSGEFTFQLVDAAGNVVAEAANDAAGNVTFEKTFTKAGKETYTIREKKGTDSTITYDEAEYTVTIEVTDNQVGELIAAVTYDKAPVFENTYKPADPVDPVPPTDPVDPVPPADPVDPADPTPSVETKDPDAVYITLEGTKVLKGGALKDGQFKFVVHDALGLEIGFGTNEADGTIVFDAIPVSAVGTHLWTVAEVNGGEEGITYDTDKIAVVVKAEEVDGELKVTVSYPNGKIKFTNLTGDATAPATGDEAPIALYAGLLVAFVAGLSVMIILKKKKEKEAE